jgi:hypothetical protein
MDRSDLLTMPLDAAADALAAADANPRGFSSDATNDTPSPLSPTTGALVAAAAKDLGPPHACRTFTGYMRGDGLGYDPQGLVLRCMLNTPVPCTMEEFAKLGKNKRIAMTILAVSKLGWAMAPFKKTKPTAGKKAADKDAPKPKPLFEAEELAPLTKEILSVRLYNFLKANANTDRGDRVDDSVSLLRVGQASSSSSSSLSAARPAANRLTLARLRQVITFFLTHYAYDEDEKKIPVFPKGLLTLPAFTVVEIVVSPSHTQSDGFGVNLRHMAPHDSSLYSYMTPAALEALPHSEAEAMQFYEAMESK